MNLVRTMAVEWAPHNIWVNAIAPGSIITPRIPATPERVDIPAKGSFPPNASAQATKSARPRSS